MNNIVKIALALAAGSSLLYLGLRKKSKKINLYIAPDGNIYKENQIYKSYDNKFYKNGKEFHYKIPDLSDTPYEIDTNYNTMTAPLHVSYKVHHRNPVYHHKGLRHQ